MIKISVLKAKIVNRPSKSIKSPYLADIEINNNIELAHSPSLGLCGLITKDVNVMVTKCENECRKSKYTIELIQSTNSKDKKVWIGANPLFGNKIFSIFYTMFLEFKNYVIEKQEIKVLDSRLDFLLVNNSKQKCYVEIKCVPLISYNEQSNIISAIFPDGYKNSKNICISDRAYKHVENLIKLKSQGHRACLVFIIQREDPENFTPNYIRDKIYSDKLKEALNYGVEIYAYKFKWTIRNNIATCKFLEKLEIIYNIC
jgi:sugar fermentation stimulation protein A